MKTFRIMTVTAGVIFAVGLNLALYAQVRRVQMGTGPVSLIDIRLLEQSESPDYATFYLVSDFAPGRVSPPYPANPCPLADVYALDCGTDFGIYLVDNSGLDGQQKEAAIAAALLSLESQGALPSQAMALSPAANTRLWSDSSGGEGSPMPDAGFDTNFLWLEFALKTNSTAYLVIHPPWNVTNGVYDLFAATNLAPAWWERVLRCAPGQTNLTVTNLAAETGFFILGLTNDADGGGISSAWEGLLGLDPKQSRR